MKTKNLVPWWVWIVFIIASAFLLFGCRDERPKLLFTNGVSSTNKVRVGYEDNLGDNPYVTVDKWGGNRIYRMRPGPTNAGKWVWIERESAVWAFEHAKSDNMTLISATWTNEHGTFGWGNGARWDRTNPASVTLPSNYMGGNVSGNIKYVHLDHNPTNVVIAYDFTREIETFAELGYYLRESGPLTNRYGALLWLDDEP